MFKRPRPSMLPVMALLLGIIAAPSLAQSTPPAPTNPTARG